MEFTSERDFSWSSIYLSSTLEIYEARGNDAIVRQFLKQTNDLSQ